MKKLLTLIVLMALSFATFAQDTTAPAPKLDTLTANFQILNLYGDTAHIMSAQLNKKYEVSVQAELNPYNYVLAKDRIYTICLERDMNLVYKFQTRGQTKTIPARIIWFTISENQLKKDQVQLMRYIEEEPGYDRSPRY